MEDQPSIRHPAYSVYIMCLNPTNLQLLLYYIATCYEFSLSSLHWDQVVFYFVYDGKVVACIQGQLNAS